jgi:hypothetical protein
MTSSEASPDRLVSRGTEQPNLPLSGTSLSRDVLRGVVGGLVATAVMTVYRLPIFRSLPPTAEFWARYVGGGEAEEYPFVGLVLHFLYGGVGGGLFGGLFARLSSRTSLPREPLGVASGVGFGGVLSVFGTRVVFPYLLGRDLEADERLVFHVGHLVYGLTIGTWVAKRESAGEVYD